MEKNKKKLKEKSNKHFTEKFLEQNHDWSKGIIGIAGGVILSVPIRPKRVGHII